jgi:hypothetical protein
MSAQPLFYTKTIINNKQSIIFLIKILNLQNYIDFL